MKIAIAICVAVIAYNAANFWSDCGDAVRAGIVCVKRNP